jgi:hypothetical protein
VTGPMLKILQPSSQQFGSSIKDTRRHLPALSIMDTSFKGCRCSCHGFSNSEYNDVNTPTEILASRLDKAIRQARQHLHTLLIRRNAIVPASRLPAELLLRIFISLQQASGPFEPRWVSVTRVCRQWRAVSVSAP